MKSLPKRICSCRRMQPCAAVAYQCASGLQSTFLGRKNILDYKKNIFKKNREFFSMTSGFFLKIFQIFFDFLNDF